MKPLLSLKNIHKYFGRVHSVKGVSFDLFPGEVTAFLGDNGAGKSTTIKMLSGVLQPSSGSMQWQGKSILIESAERARQIGIETVYQDRAIIPDLSVAQNIFIHRELTRGFWPFTIVDHACMAKEATKLVRELQLNIATPHQEARFCSGGELQGIAIARAMYFKAPLVILDEPTTALAVSGVKRVLGFIDKLRAEGVSVLFVTHNLHEAHAIADRFVIMRQGHVVANQPKSKLSLKEITHLIQTEYWTA